MCGFFSDSAGGIALGSTSNFYEFYFESKTKEASHVFFLSWGFQGLKA